MLARTPSDTRLLIPGLAGFYGWAPEVGYLLLRVTIGGILFVHGWMKVQAGFDAEVGFFVKVGFVLPVLCAFAVIFLETVAAACVALGLFTRFFSAALAIQMLVILITAHWAKGFSVGAGGYEYVLLLGMVYFYIALRGGGRYSLDAKLGKEL